MASRGLGSAPAQVQRERTAAVPEPELVRSHDVPAGPLARLQQVVDGRRGASLGRVPVRLERDRGPPGLAKPAPLRMGPEIQLLSEHWPWRHSASPVIAVALTWWSMIAQRGPGLRRMRNQTSAGRRAGTFT